MRRAIQIPAVLLCLVFLLLASPATAQASSEAPYETYTYDKWGNAVPSPNAYIPTRSFSGSQLGCGPFNAPRDLFYSEACRQVYVADTKNNRIVILTEEMELVRELRTLTAPDGSEYQFGEPEGIFVKDDGTMYVADALNGQVVRCTDQGELLSILPTPESSLLPDNFIYKPSKVVVDSNDRVYIQANDLFQGLVYLDENGDFIKFFGANEVEMTFKRQVLKLWKTLLSDKAAGTLQDFNPIEYSNIFLSPDGYVYGTAAATENTSSADGYQMRTNAFTAKSKSKMVVKLNPLGVESLPFRLYAAGALYSDVTVDENGIMTVLDRMNGKLCQYNASGTQLFTFGGTGAQAGLFQDAVSLIEIRGDLYVMDALKNTITEFSLTEFGALVLEAINLYDAGLYQQCMEPWREVIRRNGNYQLAYSGLGKAYYQIKDYETSMYYFKLANDRSGYSDAFREVSLHQMRNSFGWIVLAVAVVLTAVALWRRFRRQGRTPLKLPGWRKGADYERSQRGR